MIAHDHIASNTPKADLIRFRSLGEGFVKRPMEVVFITLNDKARYEEVDYKGAKLYKIPLVSKKRMVQLICFALLLLPALLRTSQRDPFHILFLNSVFSIPAATIYRALSRNGLLQFDLMGLLSEERFPLTPKTVWKRIAKKGLILLENFLLTRMDFITTINEQHKKLLQRRTTRPVEVIRDGVPEEVLSEEWIPLKKAKDLGKMVIIFVGQINHSRLDPILKTFPALLKEFPNLQLQVVGSGPQLSRYLGMANVLGIRGHVLFEGHLSHEKMFDVLAKADIAYSDDWSIHGFPMKIFEYMAMGKPMVIEGTESVKELLIDHVNALLYKSDAELEEKILTLIRDGELRKRIGKNARQMVDAHTWEKRVEALTSIYQHYLGSREN